MLKIGIDLLWVRPQKVGGSESYVRNLLDGFSNNSSNEFKFILFVSKDNEYSFLTYENNSNFILKRCNVRSEKILSRIIWENLFLNKIAAKEKIDVMFIPIYSKPFFRKKLSYVTTIHDLQALHYPEYFSRLKNIWLKFSWKNSIKTSKKIITISNFVKDDILKNFNVRQDEIQVIYNPVKIQEEMSNFEELSKKLKIESKKYFYTVSSMLPHKNLEVLLNLIKKLKMESNYEIPNKLVISGIGGTQKEPLVNLINNLKIEGNIIMSGFVSNSERNSLYKNAYAFLFPSIFEGFGMPPIEAMMLGTPVITTKLASIPEVTQGKCIYVDDPKNVEEWYEKIIKIQDMNFNKCIFEEYHLERISKKYLETFYKIVNKN